MVEYQIVQVGRSWVLGDGQMDWFVLSSEKCKVQCQPHLENIHTPYSKQSSWEASDYPQHDTLSGLRTFYPLFHVDFQVIKQILLLPIAEYWALWADTDTDCGN